MPSRKNQKHRREQRYEDALRRRYRTIKSADTEGVLFKPQIVDIMSLVIRKADRVEFDQDATPFVLTDKGRMISL